MIQAACSWATPSGVAERRPAPVPGPAPLMADFASRRAVSDLAAQVGTSQIVMGTDHPIPWQTEAVDHILKTPSLSDAERAAILGETAAKLLGIRL